MGFPRQEYWSRLPFPSPRDLAYPGIKPTSLLLAGRFFITEPPGKPNQKTEHRKSCMYLQWWGYQQLKIYLYPTCDENKDHLHPLDIEVLWTPCHGRFSFQKKEKISSSNKNSPRGGVMGFAHYGKHTSKATLGTWILNVTKSQFHHQFTWCSLYVSWVAISSFIKWR